MKWLKNLFQRNHAEVPPYYDITSALAVVNVDSIETYSNVKIIHPVVRHIDSYIKLLDRASTILQTNYEIPKHLVPAPLSIKVKDFFKDENHQFIPTEEYWRYFLEEAEKFLSIIHSLDNTMDKSERVKTNLFRLAGLVENLQLLSEEL